MQALANWMKIKARRHRKKITVNKNFQTTARKLFHDDHWLTVIRPKVVKKLKEDNSSNPYWLSTMKKVERKLWKRCKVKEVYEQRAKEINEGRLAAQAKAEYVLFTWEMGKGSPQ